MTSIGAIFSPYTNAPEALPAAARAAEATGIDELWLWEDCFRESAFAAASAALSATSRLRIGIGIAPMPMRNVAVTAMEIATLARLFPARLLPGVGHGVQDWMAQVGARVASPLTLMREYVPALRALLAGDEVTVSGRYVRLDAVRLDWPPAAVPAVYAAAEGPKTVALSGAVADGTVLDSKHTLDEVSQAVASIRAGRTDAGRDGAPDIVSYVATVFGPDGLDRAAAEWFGGAVDGGAGTDGGTDGRVDDTASQSGPSVRVEARAAASERVLTGTVEEVATGVRRFAAAGVDHVVLQHPADEPSTEAYFEMVGEVARLVR